MNKKLAEMIYDHIEKRSEAYKQLMKRAIEQAVIAGECTVRMNDKQELEIVNPFKGCTCDSGEE